MAARLVAGRDAADTERHDLPIEQAQNRLQRSDPVELASTPSHRLRPRYAGDRVWQEFGEDLARAPSGFAHQGKQHARLAVVTLFEGIVEVGEPAHEACARLLGRIRPRTLALDDAVALT